MGPGVLWRWWALPARTGPSQVALAGPGAVFRDDGCRDLVETAGIFTVTAQRCDCSDAPRSPRVVSCDHPPMTAAVPRGGDANFENGLASVSDSAVTVRTLDVRGANADTSAGCAPRRCHWDEPERNRHIAKPLARSLAKRRPVGFSDARARWVRVKTSARRQKVTVRVARKSRCSHG